MRDAVDGAMDDPAVAFAMREIASHLDRRPADADTLEGVHRGWIDWPAPYVSPAATAAALERLAAAGGVEALRVGGRTLWRRSRSTD